MFLPGALSLCVVQRVQSPFARTLLAFYTAVQRVAFARFLHRRATRLLTISKFVADSVAARSSYSLSVEGTLRQRMKGTSAQDSEH
jgi:hypothetical protein